MKKKGIIISSIGVFLLFFSIFLFIHSTIHDFLGTDDPYYHAKHSQLIAESGKLTLVKPWIAFHFLSATPADPYFLSHLVAANLIKIFGTIWGIKILSTLFASSIFFVFYLILKQEQVRHTWIFVTLFFFSSVNFIFRLTLERPYVFSIALLLMAYYLIRRKKYLWLFALSVLYILFYNLAPLVIFLAILFILAEIYQRKPVNLKPLIATSGGIFAGLMLHPQTLNYVYIIYTHFVRILLLKLRGVTLPSGAEIVIMPISLFFKSNSVLLFFFVLTAGFFIAKGYYRRDTPAHILVLSAMTAFWFCISILVSRGVEYWVPFAWLLIAIIWQRESGSEELKLIKKSIQQKVSPAILLFFLTSILIIVFLYNFSLYSYIIIKHNKEDSTILYQEANDWLKENTPADSLVFYPNWSMFPLMFYYNTHNRYLTGFDPVFLYNYDPTTYWIWYNLTTEGMFCAQKSPCPTSQSEENIKQIKAAFKYIFNTNIIILKKDQQPKFDELINANSAVFEKMYENEELAIYHIN